MNENPIQVYVNDMLEQIRQNEEEQIVAEVSQTVGINVEKEELIKALQYDRNQYEKGYKDAMRRQRGHWISQDDTSKHHYGWYQCSECGAYIGTMTNYCSECGAKMENNDGAMG